MIGSYRLHVIQKQDTEITDSQTEMAIRSMFESDVRIVGVRRWQPTGPVLFDVVPEQVRRVVPPTTFVVHS